MTDPLMDHPTNPLMNPDGPQEFLLDPQLATNRPPIKTPNGLLMEPRQTIEGPLGICYLSIAWYMWYI